MGLPLNDKESLAGAFEIRAREQARYEKLQARSKRLDRIAHHPSLEYMSRKSSGETELINGIKVPNSKIFRIALHDAQPIIAKNPSLPIENIIDRLWNRSTSKALRQTIRQRSLDSKSSLGLKRTIDHP